MADIRSVAASGSHVSGTEKFVTALRITCVRGLNLMIGISAALDDYFDQENFKRRAKA
jgi:hypothetical protein